MLAGVPVFLLATYPSTGKRSLFGPPAQCQVEPGRQSLAASRVSIPTTVVQVTVVFHSPLLPRPSSTIFCNTGCHNNCHKLGGLKQRRRVPSHLRSLQAQMQVPAGLQPRYSFQGGPSSLLQLLVAASKRWGP